jgi:hypothetical protein
MLGKALLGTTGLGTEAGKNSLIGSSITISLFFSLFREKRVSHCPNPSILLCLRGLFLGQALGQAPVLGQVFLSQRLGRWTAVVPYLAAALVLAPQIVLLFRLLRGICLDPFLETARFARGPFHFLSTQVNIEALGGIRRVDR